MWQPPKTFLAGHVCGTHCSSEKYFVCRICYWPEHILTKPWYNFSLRLPYINSIIYKSLVGAQIYYVIFIYGYLLMFMHLLSITSLAINYVGLALFLYIKRTIAMRYRWPRDKASSARFGAELLEQCMGAMELMGQADIILPCSFVTRAWRPKQSASSIVPCQQIICSLGLMAMGWSKPR